MLKNDHRKFVLQVRLRSIAPYAQNRILNWMPKGYLSNDVNLKKLILFYLFSKLYSSKKKKKN